MKSTIEHLTFEKAIRILEAVDSGEWKLARILPCSSLTAKANREHAWMIERQQVPYCDAQGIRVWTAPTPLAVLIKAEVAMAEITRYKKDNEC